MYFSKLPQNIKDAIVELTKDDIFQERFGTDKTLDEIEDLKANLNEEYKSLLTVLNKDLQINNKTIKNITPAQWSFLWATSSPLVTGDEVNEIDVDYFLYVLYEGIGNGNAADLFSKSIGYTKNKLQLTFEEALTLIYNMIKYSFRALKLFPATGGQAGKCFFDADWLTGVVAKVYSVTGYTPEYIMYELPLAACCYYFAQHCRQQGVDNIYKRTDEEILILQMERSVDLICERLIELNVFPPEEYTKWRTVMLTKPEGDKGK